MFFSRGSCFIYNLIKNFLIHCLNKRCRDTFYEMEMHQTSGKRFIEINVFFNCKKADSGNMVEFRAGVRFNASLPV